MCFNRSVIGCINNLALCSSGNAGTEVLNVHCMVRVIGVNGITLGQNAVGIFIQNCRAIGSYTAGDNEIVTFPDGLFFTGRIIRYL